MSSVPVRPSSVPVDFGIPLQADAPRPSSSLPYVVGRRTGLDSRLDWISQTPVPVRRNQDDATGTNRPRLACGLPRDETRYRCGWLLRVSMRAYAGNRSRGCSQEATPPGSERPDCLQPFQHRAQASHQACRSQPQPATLPLPREHDPGPACPRRSHAGSGAGHPHGVALTGETRPGPELRRRHPAAACRASVPEWSGSWNPSCGLRLDVCHLDLSCTPLSRDGRLPQGGLGQPRTHTRGSDDSSILPIAGTPLRSHTRSRTARQGKGCGAICPGYIPFDIPQSLAGQGIAAPDFPESWQGAPPPSPFALPPTHTPFVLPGSGFWPFDFFDFFSGAQIPGPGAP